MEKKSYKFLKAAIIGFASLVWLGFISLVILFFPIDATITGPGSIENTNLNVNLINAKRKDTNFYETGVWVINDVSLIDIIKAKKNGYQIDYYTDEVIDAEYNKKILEPYYAEYSYYYNIYLNKNLDQGDFTYTIPLYIAHNRDVKKIKMDFKSIYFDYTPSLEIASDIDAYNDEIILVNNKKIDNIQDYFDLINTFNTGDIIKMTTKEGQSRKALVIEKNGVKTLDIIPGFNYILQDNYFEVTDLAKEATGESAQLMQALHLYSQINNVDLTKGNKVAGTGALDMYGNVLEIAAIEFKIQAAIDEGVKYFIYPKANKIENKHHYNITFIDVDTFDEALEQLKSLFK